MKNLQKGYIIPLVIIVIALLAIGGGAYVYSQNKHSGIQNVDVSQNATGTVQGTITPATAAAPVAQSDDEAVIQAVLNMRGILSSGDVPKIRAYLLTENADNPAFTAQIKSVNDTVLLSLANAISKPLSVFDATFMRTQCKITITGDVAKVTLALTSSNPAQGSGTESVTVKKINGVWQ